MGQTDRPNQNFHAAAAVNGSYLREIPRLLDLSQTNVQSLAREHIIRDGIIIWPVIHASEATGETFKSILESYSSGLLLFEINKNDVTMAPHDLGHFERSWPTLEEQSYLKRILIDVVDHEPDTYIRRAMILILFNIHERDKSEWSVDFKKLLPGDAYQAYMHSVGFSDNYLIASNAMSAAQQKLQSYTLKHTPPTRDINRDWVNERWVGN